MRVPTSTRRLGQRGLWLLAALAWSVPSLAQGTPADAARTSPEAQSRFDAGVAAYEEGRFREAVERFKEADQLAPSPLLSFNIAKVYERMADNRSALAWYRDYLRRLPAAENRGAVRERIDVLERALRATGVQQVTVLSTPAGATVSIDNVSRGVTPWTGELIPGPHTLALTLSGYREAVSEVELPAEHAIDIDTALVAIEPVTPPAPTNAPSVAAPAGPAAPMVPESPPPMLEATWTPRWWTWAMFGGAAAGFLGAGGFELARRDMEGQVPKEPVQLERQQKFDSMEQRQTIARVFLGVGAVAAVAGGVSLYFDWQAAQDAANDVAFGCDAEGCSVAAGGRF
jgi:tetratricopeptide (TPR) repeat protein